MINDSFYLVARLILSASSVCRSSFETGTACDPHLSNSESALRWKDRIDGVIEKYFAKPGMHTTRNAIGNERTRAGKSEGGLLFVICLNPAKILMHDAACTHAVLDPDLR